MATYDVCETETGVIPAIARPRRLFAPLLQVWADVQARITERRTIHQLYWLDEHVLRDMGFDPRAIYAAREGTIGEWKSRRCGEE